MDDSIGISLLTAHSFLNADDSYLLITSNLYKAQIIYNFLSSFLPKETILLFPNDELLRAETLAVSKDLAANRIYVLSELAKKGKKIVVANLSGFLKYLPKKDVFYSNVLNLKIGQKYNLTEVKKTLIKCGYISVNKIDQTFEFAVRGDILDIYSVNLDNPVRIEFFDDEIESIRFFDISSQQSLSKLDEVTILPGSEFLYSDDELKNGCEKIRAVLEKDKADLDPLLFNNLLNLTESDIYDLHDDIKNPRLSRYFSLITDKPTSLIDYCDGMNVVLVDEESLYRADEIMQSEGREYFREMFEAGKIISHIELYRNFNETLMFSKLPCIKTRSLPKDNKEMRFHVVGVPYQANKKSDVINVIRRYLNDNYKIVINLSSNENIAFLSDVLDKEKIPFEFGHDFDLPAKGNILISLTNLTRGFALPFDRVVFLTNYELFNEKVNVARFDSRFKEATILKSHDDLKPGDYVVHEYQGIGQFLELQTLEVDGIHRDYLKIAYWGNEILYVPLSQFQLVRKYLGKEGLKPRLSHLHSKDWENTKKKIKERIQDLANRLFNLYCERAKIVGFAFQTDDEIQKAFEDSCEFELTNDQQKSLSEIKENMESPSPMDRLLCGDVGFGKTEVAFRAIFKAISSGKQVALLCPTTLLARQHYERACQRFAGFDVKIAVFSRLISHQNQNEYIKGIADGSVHLVIGTHRLLSKDIVFKDLGLLVIDEEQRFGVEQKERLKELKSNVDVLTLSATPIPRTLQISLLGVRSLSLINTPPKLRMPIQTYVLPYNKLIAKELIEREIGRGGQVFYLHNNVSTIHQTASILHKLLPDIEIGVAHGQMDKDDIETVMTNFYEGKISVLVCTTIIENGIDIPNANMIIVEDCQNYGLSQLYQIKGRVGRSDRIAYAYLMFPEGKIFNEAASKRLQAIQDFTELGSGYKIAQRDLMIRGAGDILGPEQAGFIDSIGLDMYIKLLNESVRERQTGEITKEDKVESNISLTIDAFIPESYANDSDKIELYQEIAAVSNTESLAKLKLKTKDIYGKFPQEVDLLFTKRNIDLLLKENEVRTIKEDTNKVELYLAEPYINLRGIGNILFEALIPYINKIKVSYVNHSFKIVLIKNKGWLHDLEGILFCLENIKATHKIKEIR